MKIGHAKILSKHMDHTDAWHAMRRGGIGGSEGNNNHGGTMRSIKDVQKKHKQWSERNFGSRQCKTDYFVKLKLIKAMASFGVISRSVLKTDQGIRGAAAALLSDATNATLELIKHVVEIPNLLNMYGQLDFVASQQKQHQANCVLGAVEEIGELCDAFWNDDDAAIKDAIADAHIFLTHLCTLRGYDHQSIIIETAERVLARDWNANSDNGEAGL
jgi:NTP pyrophosphatase (non-canonical NTP hydrolase)